jgi:hypothetical protein
MAEADNLLRAARALAPIREHQFVFAGASIMHLLLDDPAAPPPRSTTDVDAVVDVLTYGQWDMLRRRLAAFNVHVRADILVGKARHCLFYLDELQLDIMPVRMPQLGCPSRMLELGFLFAEPHEIEENLTILTLSAASMLAAKLEAFADRGSRELPVSDDLEDVVALLDGRMHIEAEVNDAEPETRHFIGFALRTLLSNSHVLDLVSDLLRDGGRERRVLSTMRRLSYGKTGT